MRDRPVNRFDHVSKWLTTWKQRLARRLYTVVSPVYEKVFVEQLRPDIYSLDGQQILSEFPEFDEIDRQLNYFVLHASFGDKWFILSLIQAHLDLYGTSRVIAAASDRPLVELFVGPEVASKRFIFVEEATLSRLSSFFRPPSKVSTQIADSWFRPGCMHTITPFLVENGLPPGTIRHLHLCYYPYFNELFNLHAVSYLTLLKTLLYLPFSTKPMMPRFYIEEEYQTAEEIVRSSRATERSEPSPVLLFNVVAFSHAALDLKHVWDVVSIAESAGFRVLVNAAQSKDERGIHEVVSRSRCSEVVSVPPRLLALVSERVYCVIGTLGGAMSIAAQFSRSHLLSLQTPALGIGCSEDDLFAGKAKERLWQWADKDWPCLHPGRIMENRYVGDPSLLTLEDLQQIIEPFLAKVKATIPARASAVAG
jgi:hypothetical protein